MLGVSCFLVHTEIFYIKFLVQPGISLNFFRKVDSIRTVLWRHFIIKLNCTKNWRLKLDDCF